MDGLIINVALTGCVHPASTPGLPTAPEEVADDAKRCWDAGASMFHVHARDAWGNPTYGEAAYRRYVDAVREAVPHAVVVASCSGRHFRSFGERAGAIRAEPDMASLTVGSYNFGRSASVNEPSMIKKLASAMQAHGVVPEIECFEIGHVRQALRLADGGLLKPPFWFNLFLGVLPPEKRYLEIMAEMLPEGALWAGAGLGRCQWDANRWAIEAGGHVRVGLEDSLWLEKGVRATNAAQVERAVEYGRALGREPCQAWEARL